MSSFIRHVRAACTIVLLGLVIGLIAWPALRFIILWDRIARLDGLRHRRRVAWWQRQAGRAVLRIATFGMGITVRVHLPRALAPPGPYLIICNHLGGFDGFLVLHVLSLLGRKADLRAIGKIAVASMPVVGLAWRELRWGFVVRNRDPNDYEAVEACGRIAREDEADMLIFPEGTTYEPELRKPGYAYVLPPKTGGLKVLRSLMPHRPVLNLTLRWDLENHGRGWLEGVLPFGRRVDVLVSYADIPVELEPWLREEWRRKDAWISAKTVR